MRLKPPSITALFVVMGLASCSKGVDSIPAPKLNPDGTVPTPSSSAASGAPAVADPSLPDAAKALSAPASGASAP